MKQPAKPIVAVTEEHNEIIVLVRDDPDSEVETYLKQHGFDVLPAPDLGVSGRFQLRKTTGQQIRAKDIDALLRQNLNFHVAS